MPSVVGGDVVGCRPDWIKVGENGGREAKSVLALGPQCVGAVPDPAAYGLWLCCQYVDEYVGASVAADTVVDPAPACNGWLPSPE
jgi:hypothetical protein